MPTIRLLGSQPLVSAPLLVPEPNLGSLPRAAKILPQIYDKIFICQEVDEKKFNFFAILTIQPLSSIGGLRPWY